MACAVKCRFCPTCIRSWSGERHCVPRSVPPPDWVLTRRPAIGDRIRAARLTAGLTQEQVVLRIGVDRATFNRIEMGHSAALIDSLILIAEALNTDLADFVREQPGLSPESVPVRDVRPFPVVAGGTPVVVGTCVAGGLGASGVRIGALRPAVPVPDRRVHRRTLFHARPSRMNVAQLVPARQASHARVCPRYARYASSGGGTAVRCCVDAITGPPSAPRTRSRPRTHGETRSTRHRWWG
ncbi:helix-turn-helix domain-containing protein [Streptomyces sp. NBC_01433]|uniref:helix-turn-helix domain-containing protein n=1 Tax=Streptomyces sp. NBC_01433 TaxID=2903864 RepID=UPI00225501F0|nr:helix-turn-helix transcriptional regulator [Streptomyces sp. NBC_01433]MCX4681950.1 helix-turn-helix domain-containing protein [Streptomyces sp. NBC_01433]